MTAGLEDALLMRLLLASPDAAEFRAWLEANGRTSLEFRTLDEVVTEVVEGWDGSAA